MKNKHLPIKSKLFKLKEWLTIPETASHLSIILGEEVTDADILQLAIETHLTISVYFVNEAHVNYGNIVEYGDVNWPLIDISLAEDDEKNIGLDHCDEDILDGNENLTNTCE